VNFADFHLQFQESKPIPSDFGLDVLIKLGPHDKVWCSTKFHKLNRSVSQFSIVNATTSDNLIEILFSLLSFGGDMNFRLSPTSNMVFYSCSVPHHYFSDRKQKLGLQLQSSSSHSELRFPSTKA
jgi:hypothetical protein